jgi:hypothetical protein
LASSAINLLRYIDEENLLGWVVVKA